MNKIDNGLIHTAVDLTKTLKYSENRDWKNESMKFDLNLDTKTTNDSISYNTKTNVLHERKEPLLKLSKNLGSSNMQQSISSKISIG